MTDSLLALLALAAAMTVGAMSPGPSFVMVARTSVARSRREGLAAALGMGAGGVVFASAAVLGLQAVLAAVPVAYAAVRLAGGAYLVWLGVRIWRGAREPLSLADEAAGGSPGRREASAWRAFALGLATQLSNPKTAIVYASVFAATLPQHIPPALALAAPCTVFVIETGWYSIVALALSSAGPRAAYLRHKAWVDRSAGGVMAALGLRLVWSARGG